MPAEHASFQELKLMSALKTLRRPPEIICFVELLVHSMDANVRDTLYEEFKRR